MKKMCPRCRETKGSNEFGRNAASKDGLSCYRLACNRENSRAFYRAKRRADLKDVRQPDTSPDGFKRCAECQRVKPATEFHKSARCKDGLAIYCKPCRKERGRRDHLMRTYGLGEAELAAMIKAQGGLCAICQRRPAVHVDHDHAFEVVRGVLCFPCNAALGQLQDDPQLFRNAIDYLERTYETQWQRTLVSTGVYRLTSPRPAAAASATSSELRRLVSSRRA